MPGTLKPMPRSIYLSGLAMAIACGPPRTDWHARPQPAAPSISQSATETPAWGGLRVHEIGASTRARVLVLLHGYGASGNDLVPLAQSLVDRCGDLRAVVPEAPVLLGNGRAWFSIHGTERNERNLGELNAAETAIRGALATLRQQGVEPSNIVLGGFSQGAIMSAHIALKTPRDIGELVLLSGRTLPIWPSSSDNASDLRVFISHGENDPVLAFAEGQRLSERFAAMHAQVDFQRFTGGHTIPASIVAALQNFLCAG